jgi:two-component system, chemotaxis family, CheB/CheR fusion protein
MHPAPGHPTLYDLVVIGSSAGGIEALATLLAALPPDFPAPIVLAQHLDPDRPSHLGEILARQSTLPVQMVTDPQSLTSGVVYVVPADRDVEIFDHTVMLRTDREGRPKPSINRLLGSAARAHGERLIAVILTGTGSDGAAGAWEVKAAGGMVVIQNPRTAAYPAMPAALSPTAVDLVADLEQMGTLLYDLLTGAYVPTPPEDADTLAGFLEHLREQSGIDFTQYKRPTILRRLQRRLAATRMAQLTDYMHYLPTHPEEYQKLIGSFLISVTAFFRDPDLFSVLRQQVLPELIARARTQGNELRIWSAGCATGEEAYSLAILVAELLGEEVSQFSVRIFATDLDAEAVAFARRGIYPASALAGLSPELAARYFTQVDGAYEVTKQIRELIVFGLHDLGRGAPFPRIDLVLCRNVLIYFSPDLQQRALQLFAFALRPGGYLLLGTAETPSALAECFAQVQPALKLYRRQGGRVLVPPALLTHDLPQLPAPWLPGRRTPQFPALLQALLAQPEPRRVRSITEVVGSLVLGLPIGVVVVNRQYDIQAINQAALRLLGIYRPALGADLLHLVENATAAPLRRIIDAVFQEAAAVGADEGITVEEALGERRDLQLTCYRREDEAAQGQVETVIVLITDVTSKLRARRSAEETAAGEQQRHKTVRPRQTHTRQQVALQRLTLEFDQVATANREVLKANQELTGVVYALQGRNEELVIEQEAAQSAVEEAKTLYEELQASNEELVTVNEEMEATVEELKATNDDVLARSRELESLAASLAEERRASEAGRARLEAILLSMSDAVLVVDPAGTPVLTNAAYTGMFGSATATFVPEDEDGRSLPGMTVPQRASAGAPFTMTFTLRAPSAPDGARRWFEAVGQPIRSDGEELGGVVSIRDITDRSLRRLQDEFMLLASHELRSPLASQRLALQMLLKRLPADPEDALSQPVATLAHTALLQGRRLQVLVNDLLDAGRLQNGKLRLQLAPLDLTALVTQVLETAWLQAQGQILVLDAPTEPVLVEGDAVRIEQAVLNLVINAIKYAPDTQRIDVRLRRVKGMAEIQVEDYGPGIPEADLPHLFTRFYQVGRTSARSQGGLGLGLFITRQLVSAHGGTLAVSSHEGRGTCFTIGLPLPEPADSAHRAVGQEDAGAR